MKSHKEGVRSIITLCEEIGILEGEVNPINRIIRKPAATQSRARCFLYYPIQL
jgi:hypothetical protein